jgi:tetratricopeptide (TPR) repeat protein
MSTSETAQLLQEAIELGRRRKYTQAVNKLLYLISADDSLDEAFLYLGRSFHALGEYSRAIDALRSFVEKRRDSSAGHFFLGRAYLAMNIYSHAAVHLRESLTIRPGFFQAAMLLGYTLLKLHRPDEASDLLGRLVEVNPTDESLYSGYLNSLLVSGIRHFKAGDSEYAREVFEFLKDKGKENILINLYLGMMYRETGEYEAAVDAYEAAFSESPGDELILYRTAILNIQAGNERRGRELLALLARSFPQSPLLQSGEAEHALAFQYLQRAEYQKALDHGLTILKKNPHDIPIRLIVAEAYRELGYTERALNHFTRAIERDRSNLHAHFGLSMIWWELGEYEKMLYQLDRILQYEPGNYSARYYRVVCRSKLPLEPTVILQELHAAIKEFGTDPLLVQAIAETYENEGQFETAVKWYRKCAALSPEQAEVYRAIIDLRDEVELKDLGKLFKQYLSLQPRDIEIRTAYIQHLYARESYKTVLKQIESVLPYVQDSRYLNRIRAICYRKVKDYNQAAVIYRKLLQKEPEKEEYLRPLVFCLTKTGRSEQALHLVEAALKYLPAPSLNLFLIYGVMQYKAGNSSKALDAFRSAQDVAPNDWRAYYNVAEIYRQRGMEQFANRFYERAEKLKAAAP